MFSGVAAARVSSLFQDARKVAPSIIFIDEIDAIGKVRATRSTCSVLFIDEIDAIGKVRATRSTCSVLFMDEIDAIGTVWLRRAVDAGPRGWSVVLYRISVCVLLYRSNGIVWQATPKQCSGTWLWTAPDMIRLLGILGDLPICSVCQTLPVLRYSQRCHWLRTRPLPRFVCFSCC